MHWTLPSAPYPRGYSATLANGTPRSRLWRSIVTVSFLALAETAAGQSSVQESIVAKGFVEVSDRPDGTIAFVSVDLPLAGKLDGKAEVGFILQKLSGRMGITRGNGTVTWEPDLLRILIEGLEPVVLVSDQTQSRGQRSLGGKARIIPAGSIRPYMSPSYDRSIPNGSPGTGIITHKAQAEYLLKVIP